MNFNQLNAQLEPIVEKIDAYQKMLSSSGAGLSFYTHLIQTIKKNTIPSPQGYEQIVQEIQICENLIEDFCAQSEFKNMWSSLSEEQQSFVYRFSLNSYLSVRARLDKEEIKFEFLGPDLKEDRLYSPTQPESWGRRQSVVYANLINCFLGLDFKATLSSDIEQRQDLKIYLETALAREFPHFRASAHNTTQKVYANALHLGARRALYSPGENQALKNFNFPNHYSMREFEKLYSVYSRGPIVDHTTNIVSYNLSNFNFFLRQERQITEKLHILKEKNKIQVALDLIHFNSKHIIPVHLKL